MHGERAMTDFLFALLYLAALLAAATYAFLRPHGVYWRSAAGMGAAIVLATALWWLASPMISNAAGLGAFVIWCATIVLAGVIAVAACLAATLRYLLDALGARLLAS
jgi:hypothetical protein